MAIDVRKPTGQLKRSSPTAGGANPRLTPVLGIVKDNVDPTRSGRIFVYLTDNSGLDPENKDNWRPVRFLSPFFGFTRPDAGDTDLGTYKTNPSSYGMWMSPPDIGTTVLCMFVDGDMNYGFYVGCVPEPEALQMVPAIGATDNIIPNEGEAQSYGGAKRLPVTNINTNNKNIADSSEYLTAAKPVHSYTAAIMFQQGILRDPIRGPISSSSQRETPSRVGWGISTPGRPIYEGGFDDKSIADNLKADQAKNLRVVARRGGHSIVMDDGDIIGRDQLVRIRTALGHQILMSDDGQTLMILHSNGQSYIELGKEGTVDIYSTNSVNVRTQGDLNLHADNNVNIHATKNLNIQAENIHVNSEKEYKQRVGSDYSNFTMGKHLTKVTGAMSMESGGDISMASSGIAYVNGSKVNLNTGQTSTKPVEVPSIEKTLHTDTLFEDQKGFIAAPAKLVSITSRAPAHAPWSNAGQGVDVKTDLGASSQLPASPASSVANTNSVAGAALTNPVSLATAASAPTASAVSKALDGKTTQALTAAVAQKASAGPLAAATTQGTAIAASSSGPQVGVGKFALTPSQLEKAGTLKPGAGALVTSLAAATGNVASSMTKNLFTGQPGAESLGPLLNNVSAQSDAVVKNLQSAQTALQNAGALTGNETGSQLGGMVMSAANNGVNATLGAIKSTAGSLVGGKGFSVSGLDNVMQDIAGGNFAAGIGEGSLGALSGIKNSVDSLIKSPSLAGVVDQAKGISAGAFSAIAASFKPMKAGIPQNLSALAKQSADSTLEASGSDITNALSQTAQSVASLGKSSIPGLDLAASATGASSLSFNLAGSASKILPSTGTIADSLVQASKSAASVVGAGINTNLSSLSTIAKSTGTAATAFASPSSLVKGVSSLSAAASSAATGLLSSTSSSFASGLNSLPGGAGAVASITNLAKGGLPALPGTGDLKGAITGAATNALNGIGSQLAGKAGGLLSKVSGAAGGLTAALTAGLPSGAASELQSALGSIASAGSGIKVPSIALNTTNRDSINAAVVSQLGDPAIPAPKFGEIDEATVGKVDDIATQKTEYILAQGELIVASLKAENNMNETLDKYLTAQQNLPPGDPQIEIAKAAYDAAIAEYTSSQDKLKKLDEQYPAIALAVYGNSTSETNQSTTSNTTVSVINRTVIPGSGSQG